MIKIKRTSVFIRRTLPMSYLICSLKSEARIQYAVDHVDTLKKNLALVFYFKEARIRNKDSE